MRRASHSNTSKNGLSGPSATRRSASARWRSSDASRSATAASCLPSRRSCQLRPPSCVIRTVPPWPTATPWSASAKRTIVRVTLTGLGTCFQVLPMSSLRTITPRSPTASTGSPARASANNTERSGWRTCKAGRCSASPTGAANAPCVPAILAAATSTGSKPFTRMTEYFTGPPVQPWHPA